MFEKTKTVCKRGLNNFKENVVELKDNTAEFISENGEKILLVCGGMGLAWLMGALNGINLTNKTLLDSYKSDKVECLGTGLKFKKPMNFNDWMCYLDNMYNKKGGHKNKNIMKYLKEKGFID